MVRTGIALLLLAGVLLLLPLALGAQLGEDEAVRCEMQGGCLLVTRDWIVNRLKAAYEAGEKAATCRVPKT